jgi:hypothetical protein
MVHFLGKVLISLLAVLAVPAWSATSLLNVKRSLVRTLAVRLRAREPGRRGHEVHG